MYREWERQDREKQRERERERERERKKKREKKREREIAYENKDKTYLWERKSRRILCLFNVKVCRKFYQNYFIKRYP